MRPYRGCSTRIVYSRKVYVERIGWMPNSKRQSRLCSNGQTWWTCSQRCLKRSSGGILKTMGATASGAYRWTFGEPEEISMRLVAVGVMRREDGRTKFFSPLLSRWLHKMRNENRGLLTDRAKVTGVFLLTRRWPPSERLIGCGSMLNCRVAAKRREYQCPLALGLHWTRRHGRP